MNAARSVGGSTAIRCLAHHCTYSISSSFSRLGTKVSVMLLGAITVMCADRAHACTGPPAGDLAVALNSSAASVARTGLPRQMRVVVPHEKSHITVCEGARISLTTPVVDPVDQQAVMRRVSIESVSAEASRLVLLVNGPVAEGAVLRFEDQALMVDGVTGRAVDVKLPGISPSEATFWYKALEPTVEGQNLLGRASYPRSASIEVAMPQPTSAAANLTALKGHYEAMIRVGFLTRARADELLALMQAVLDGKSVAIGRVFRSADGVIDARLLAATLANAGTVLDGAIDAILHGKHAAKRPVRIYFERADGPKKQQPGIASAFVWITEVVSIVLSHEARSIPLPALATLIGHEALHQDLAVGLPEELIASLAQFTAYAQHVLADPGIVRLGTDAVRASNTRLVGLMNSGATEYPAPGLGASVLVQRDGNIFQGSMTDWKSLSDILQRRAYLNVKDAVTPGNALLDSVAGRLTGGVFSGLNFSDDTIRKLANVRVLTWEHWAALAHILRLQLPRDEPADAPN